MKKHGWCAVSTIIIIFSLNATLFTNVSGQNAATWGRISHDDLKWTVFEADTNANAVILSDVGEVEFVGRYDLHYHRHTRIKILNSDGYSWGDVAIRYYSDRREMQVIDVAGQTFNFEGDGVVVQELDKRDIHVEDVGMGYSILRFSMPALQPGSVIEYKYTVVSESFAFLEEWVFQDREPTLWSEFTATIPVGLHYVSLTQTFQEFEIQESFPVSRIQRLDRDRRGQRTRWVMTNVPALRDEPYMTTRNDYLNKIRFQLKSYELPGMGVHHFMQDWKNLVNTVHGHDNFGGELRSSRSNRTIRALLPDILPGSVTDKREIMRMLYDYVRTNVEWNGRYRITATQPVRRTLETHEGASSDIGLLLTAMLVQADIDAQPVIISTRSKGMVVELYPMVGQFNHVLTLVHIDGEYFLLDATDRDRPWNLLPYEALNDVGLVIKRNDVMWIGINPPDSFSSTTVGLIEITGDGLLKGQVQYSPTGYSALAARRHIRDESEDDFLEEVLLKSLPNSNIVSHECQDVDDVYTDPVFLVEFENSEHALVVNDRIIIDPVIINRFDNPFTMENRYFPVNFGFLQHLTTRLTFTIPEGYEVEELPKSVGFDFGEAGAYRFICERVGNSIQLVIQKAIYETVIPADAYSGLREFYNEIVTGQNQQIVLKRTGAAEDMGALRND